MLLKQHNNKENLESSFQTKQMAFNKRRNSESFGKIMKNSGRIKTQATKSIATQTDFKRQGIGSKLTRVYTQMDQSRNLFSQKSSSNQKYTLKSEISLEKYQNKLAQYQKNKRMVLRDLGRINTSQFIHQNEKIQKLYQNKNQLLLPMKMKHSFKFGKFSKQIEKQIKLDQKQNIQLKTNKQIEKQKFLKEIDQLVRLENKLRKLKMQICSGNRKQIKNVIGQFFSQYQYDQDRLMKIDYEEFEPPIHCEKQTAVMSPQILSQKLIQIFQMCQTHWKEKLHKKFETQFVRELYQQINNQNKIQLDLKVFAREFNILFNRNYHSRQLFRIYQRINPVTKGNFIYNFSK